VGRRRPPVVHGLLVVDKPAGVTSHDVVGMARRRLGERRIGHAGTLDPDATGVLLVGVGWVTRLMRYLQGMDKDYVAQVVLGVRTDTLDSSGKVVATCDPSGVTGEAVRAAATALTGEIDQVPPMVSALKVDGRRLHELAREGVEVERAPRRVTVSRFEVEPTGDPAVWDIAVTVSSGTYVRSLADDLGQLLGVGGHLRALRRTRVGPFHVDEAAPPDAAVLLPAASALRGMARIEGSGADVAAARTGRTLPRPGGDGPWALVDASGALVAVYEADGDRARPEVVLAEPVA
jgi:tRNA pseudouridine55 synthase